MFSHLALFANFYRHTYGKPRDGKRRGEGLNEKPMEREGLNEKPMEREGSRQNGDSPSLLGNSKTSKKEQ